MLRLYARAKINWTLDILGQRADGYHLMDMLMQTVDLADILTLEASETFTLRTEGMEDLPMKDNLVLRAAVAFQNATGYAGGASFHLEKHTPVGAGMGGGSADAAAVLFGLNRLWNIGLNLDTLADIGATLGADVPFLLYGGLARVGGIGERIVSLKPAPMIPLVVLQPCQALSTKEVFTAFDSLSKRTHPDTDKAQASLLTGNLSALAEVTGNVLQAVSEQKRPQIGEAIAALDALGASPALMTGSGSAVFGAFPHPQAAAAAYRVLRKRWRRCWLTTTTETGIVEA